MNPYQRYNQEKSSPYIGIITALPKEYSSIKHFLHNRREHCTEHSGANQFLVGNIPAKNFDASHTIVLGISGMGNNIAATRAAKMLAAYPNLEYVIMVGIAGAVPNPSNPEDHVRLGDVVISDHKGIIQYDFVKETKQWTKIRSSPTRPSASLLEAVSLLQIDELDGKYPWEELLKQGLDAKRWCRPDNDTDILAPSDDPTGNIVHPSDSQRRSNIPRIFNGSIASANNLLKNPQKRDMLRDEFHVKAIEMEGSGIVDATWDNNVGYLVIRGTCDYCDVNKNDQWQDYAAMVAAAYTTALIASIPVNPDQQNIVFEEASEQTACETIAAPDFLPTLVEQMRFGRVILLLGPLCSQAAGFDFQGCFIAKLCHALNKHDDTDSAEISQLANIYVDEQYKLLNNPIASRFELLNLINQTLREVELKNNYDRNGGSIYKQIAQLPISTIYNTNWDSLLESALTGQHYIRLDEASLAYGTTSGQAKKIIAIHGTVPGQVNQLVATSDDLHYDFQRACAPRIFTKLCNDLKAGNLLLCVGFGLTDLLALRYLERVTALQSGKKIYALLNTIEISDANKLNQRHIVPIDLEASGQAIDATVNFLDSVKIILDGGNSVYAPPLPIISQPEVEVTSEPILVQEDPDQIDAYKTCFRHWPTEHLPTPPPPPSHPLLDSVYVERGVSESIKADISRGAKTGISGLLGMGGVGKTYTAMKIAHDLRAKGWEIAWATLLQQGADDVLDDLASQYDLAFVSDLGEQAKADALKQVFNQLSAQERKTLFVLDNAERFPNLGLLLDMLGQHPVLITSRSNECADIVAYRSLEAMSNTEGLEFTEQLLTRHLPDYELTNHDANDLEMLIEQLGGHPLGIRLALAGFFRQSPLEQKQPRPFQVITEELQYRGIRALADSQDPDSGRAGESIHRSIYQVFDWVFAQLPDEGKVGRDARLILPLLAVLGAIEVRVETLKKAASNLEKLNKNKEMFELCNNWCKSFSITGEPLKDEDGNIWMNWQSLFKTDEVCLPLHPDTDFDEDRFQDLLFGSVSLTLDDKRRVIQKVPTLKIEQINKFIYYLEEEREQFGDRWKKHKNGVRKLIQEREQEAVINRITTDEHVSGLKWFKGLTDISKRLDKTLACLTRFALIDPGDNADSVRIHPLIRQFAFEERNRDIPLILDGRELSQSLGNTAPTLLAYFRCGLDLFEASPKTHSRDAFIDLLPRLRRFPDLTETVIKLVNKLKDYYYYVLGDWGSLTQAWTEALAMAEAAGRSEDILKVKSKLGELQDRMNDPEGLVKLKNVAAELKTDVSSWVRSYLVANDEYKIDQETIRKNLLYYRLLIANGVNSAPDVSIVAATFVPIIDQWPEGNFLKSYSAMDGFLSNVVLDLTNWFDAFSPLWLDSSDLVNAEQLFDSCNRKMTKHLQKDHSGFPRFSNNFISPGNRIPCHLALARAKVEHGLDTVASFETQCADFASKARAAGLPTTFIEIERLEYQWQSSIQAGDREQVQRLADKLLALEVKKNRSTPITATLFPRLRQFISICFNTPIVTEQEDELRHTLKDIKETAVQYGRTGLQPWLLLSEAILHAATDTGDKKDAVRFLMQVRHVFRSMNGGISPTVEALYKWTVQQIDKGYGHYENLRDELSQIEKIPGHLCDWQIDVINLPKRVYSRRDGRNMLLVQPGLQGTPNGREAWFYPFYIDEEPVSGDKFEQFLQSERQTQETDHVHDNNPILLNDPAVAREFAEWSGKQLPTLAEWQAVARQFVFEQPAYSTCSWLEAKDRYLDSIEKAIAGKIKHYPIPPNKKFNPKIEQDILRAFCENDKTSPLNLLLFEEAQALDEKKTEHDREMHRWVDKDKQKPVEESHKWRNKISQVQLTCKCNDGQLDVTPLINLLVELLDKLPAIMVKLTEINGVTWPINQLLTLGQGKEEGSYTVLFGDPTDQNYWITGQTTLELAPRFGLRLTKSVIVRGDLADFEPLE